MFCELFGVRAKLRGAELDAYNTDAVAIGRTTAELVRFYSGCVRYSRHDLRAAHMAAVELQLMPAACSLCRARYRARLRSCVPAAITWLDCSLGGKGGFWGKLRCAGAAELGGGDDLFRDNAYEG
jgi:hypothetical protein